MTAPDPRSRLLALLADSDAVKQGWAEHLADELLPVVREIAKERAAKAMEQYATDLDRVVHTSDWSVRIPMAGGLDSVAQALRGRANEIRESQ